MKIKGGELFSIKLSDGSVAVGKVIWRGKKSVYRRAALLGIYIKADRSQLSSASLSGLKPRKLYYVLTDVFEDARRSRWEVFGFEKITPAEALLNVRVYAGMLYEGENFIRAVKPAEWENYLNGQFIHEDTIEKEIHKLFRVPYRERTARRSSIPTSFPWTEAIEWTAALGWTTSWKPVEKATSAVAKAKYAEMDECHEAVAAAEVVAAAKGKPAKNLPAEVKQWVAKYQSKFDSSLVDLAIRAVGRVCTDSELQQEWDESTSLNDWKKHVTGLLKRLKA